MRAKQFCVLTTTESRGKIWRQYNAFKPGVQSHVSWMKSHHGIIPDASNLG